MPVNKGMPPMIKPPYHCEFKIISKYFIPKKTKIQPPIVGHFQAAIAAPKATIARIRCAKESCQPNSGLNPSKINIAKKATIKIDDTLGK